MKRTISADEMLVCIDFFHANYTVYKNQNFFYFYRFLMKFPCYKVIFLLMLNNKLHMIIFSLTVTNKNILTRILCVILALEICAHTVGFSYTSHYKEKSI